MDESVDYGIPDLKVFVVDIYGVGELVLDFEKSDGVVLEDGKPGSLQIIDLVDMPTKKLIDKWMGYGPVSDAVLCKFLYDGCLLERWFLELCRPVSLTYKKNVKNDEGEDYWVVDLTFSYEGAIRFYAEED